MKSKNKIKLITHNGSFHADDIFAAATLSLMLEVEGQDFEVVRTRDEEEIKNAEYVFDVGGVHDPETNRFDHHQLGGAGKHANGIELASFGLVWKKFGAELCGSKAVAELIENKLVSPIDAADNAVELVDFKNEVKPYFIQNAFRAFRPSWKLASEETLLLGFLQCVKMAKDILANEIELGRDGAEAQEAINACYENTKDKKIIVFDRKYPWEEQIFKYSEPLFVIFPRPSGGLWGAEAVPAELYTFQRRKSFPEKWAGLRDLELQKITGVEDAVFCHRGRYMVVAGSKEGAIALANKALAESSK
ncbi:MAG TPA: MYG1 family protein [Candidatus Paceibacterota bacterium]